MNMSGPILEVNGVPFTRPVKFCAFCAPRAKIDITDLHGSAPTAYEIAKWGQISFEVSRDRSDLAQDVFHDACFNGRLAHFRIELENANSVNFHGFAVSFKRRLRKCVGVLRIVGPVEWEEA